jgi:copper chaperone CopZ
MEKVIINVPSMYADHHVMVVRDMLVKMDGVKDVYASSAFRQVLVHFDPSAVQKEAIIEKITQAGYTQEMIVPVQEKLAEDAWKSGTFRRTQTYQADREMSGEFRKY